VLWMAVHRGEPVTAALRQVLVGLSGQGKADTAGIPS
jgi:hypothetical protein